MFELWKIAFSPPSMSALRILWICDQRQMKTARDPRHQKRRDLVKFLFAQSFTDQIKKPQEYAEILAGLKSLDQAIAKAAPQWPIDKLNKIDLAILRAATWELSTKSTPPKVVIDVAIELAKELGSGSSPSFINGVLGTIYTKEKND